jgi:hypothetical protein
VKSVHNTRSIETARLSIIFLYLAPGRGFNGDRPNNIYLVDHVTSVDVKSASHIHCQRSTHTSVINEFQPTVRVIYRLFHFVPQLLPSLSFVNEHDYRPTIKTNSGRFTGSFKLDQRMPFD